MTHYIGIHGKKRVGKDTLARFLENYIYVHLTCGVDICSFADSVRYVLASLYGEDYVDWWSDDKNQETPIRWADLHYDIRSKYNNENEFLSLREALQIFGTDLMRKKWDTNIWTYYPFLDCDYDYRILPDIRFLNEAKAIKSHNGILIYLRRDTGCQDKHDSENQDIPEFMFDFTINVANGMEEYKNQIKEFIEQNKERLFNVCD